MTYSLWFSLFHLSCGLGLSAVLPHTLKNMRVTVDVLCIFCISSQGQPGMGLGAKILNSLLKECLSVPVHNVGHLARL